jgi:hypothetical protein
VPGVLEVHPPQQMDVRVVVDQEYPHPLIIGTGRGEAEARWWSVSRV